MKRTSTILVWTRFQLAKLVTVIIHPMGWIPVPDFNKQYDSSML